MKCVQCGNEYDIAETQRVYGFGDWTKTMCSAHCYSLSILAGGKISDEPKLAIAGPVEIPLEKVAMIKIIMSLEDFTDPVAMQSISDAALQRKRELEENNNAD